MEAIKPLKEYDHIPPNEKCMALLATERSFLRFKKAMEEEQIKPENVRNIIKSYLQLIFNCPSWNHPLFYFDDDEDDYIPLGDIIARYSTSKAITPDLPIEEPDNSLSMGDEHLDTISSVEILVPIPSELEGISDDTCDVPVCDDSSTFDALNDNSEILSDSNNDGTSSDDDDYEDVEFEEMNDVDQEEKEFDLEDIFQIQDVILREKLLNVHRLISNIESLKDNPTPGSRLEPPHYYLTPS
ncbi:hypothetical protein Tco_1054101 [Tanacetum coccineum]|uniref:Uncharacterized protein n=1 Tax=Tanacetum coccineum TaxID=301880 RepID=A0ABQ5GWQ2_9ASTR